MVFESFKRKLLELELKRAKASSVKETGKVKKEMANLRGVQSKKAAILKEKLKIEAEHNKLKKQIANAKKLNLTPTEKRLLAARAKARKEKLAKLNSNLKTTGRVLGAATLTTLKFIDKALSEPPKKRRTKKKAVKRTVKKKKYKR